MTSKIPLTPFFKGGITDAVYVLLYPTLEKGKIPLYLPLEKEHPLLQSPLLEKGNF